MAQVQYKGWGQMEDPPKLNQHEWNMAGVLGLVFLAMAILQLLSFNQFSDWFEAIGMSSGTTWAVVVIVAEVWAALGLFKVRLHGALRTTSRWAAVLVSGFWFLESLRLVSETKMIENSGFFGKYLAQTPGWWTVLEATILLFWTIHVVNLTKTDK